MPIDRRAEALSVAEQLLADFELSDIKPVDLARRASRVARLLDDVDALTWLSYEISGYDTARTTDGLPLDAKLAAARSGRGYLNEDGKRMLKTQSISEMQSIVETYKLHLASSSDAPISVSSANPYQAVRVPSGNARERLSLSKEITRVQPILDQVLGSIYQYVSAKSVELRFGSAVETAFERVRNVTDSTIADLVPDAIQKLTAAFELATSSNPEHWADAAAYCRKLIIEVAGALQPAGQPINGRKNGEENYVNRLAFWIEQRLSSGTTRTVLVSDLEHFGKRLDAFTGAGNKGAHERIEQYDADRFIVGTYVLIADILRLHSPEASAVSIETAGQTVKSLAEPKPASDPLPA